MYWEDVATGAMEEIGRVHVSKQDILAFARHYDPQPFHLDEEAAKQSILGGLCASGWHVCALAASLAEKAEGGKSQIVGADEIEEWRWVKPVYAGEMFILRGQCVEKRDGGQTGSCRYVWEAVNEAGEIKTKVSFWRTLAKKGVS